MQYSKRKSIYISLLWGLFAVIGIVKYLKIGVAERNYSNNILYFCFYFMAVVLIYQAQRYFSKKNLVISGLFAIFVSGILIIGAQIEYMRAISWTVVTALKIILLSCFLLPVFILCFQFCIRYRAESTVWEKGKWVKWKIFLVIFLIWGITYLALFPGIYDYDSIDQTLQFLVTKKISSHHPVAHSFLLSAFLEIGNRLFHSYEVGLGIFSLLQMALLAYVASEISWRLLKRNHKILFYMSLLFYTLLPLHSVMAVWVAKDLIFTAFFALTSLSLYDMICQKDEFWSKKRNWMRYIILVILMCMFRNNAIYALIFMMPVCFFCYKKDRKKLLLVTAGGICLYLAYQNVMLPKLGVTPGNMREMMSIPCQQMAKVYVETPDVYTQEEKEALFQLIPEKNINDYQYRPMIADATKNYFNSEEFKSDLTKYAKLYVNIGLKSPRKYIEAFLTNSLGFWYPNKSYPDERMFHPYMEFYMADPDLFKGDYIYLERKSMFPLYEKVLEKVIVDTVWEEIPLVSNLFVPGTYFLLLCFGIIVVCLKRSYSKLLILGLWSGYWITLLISPVALVRYAYPVIFCLPLLGLLITDKVDGKSRNYLKKGKQNGKNSSINTVL